MIPEGSIVIPKRSEESPGEAGPLVWNDALRAGILRCAQDDGMRVSIDA
jgi:hypothetical protein